MQEWSLEPILLPSEVEQLQQALGTEEPQTAAHLLRAHLQYAIMREQEPEVGSAPEIGILIRKFCVCVCTLRNLWQASSVMIKSLMATSE